MTERNALIRRKIALYTDKFTRTKKLALEAVHWNPKGRAAASPLLREVVRLSLAHEATEKGLASQPGETLPRTKDDRAPSCSPRKEHTPC